MARNLIMGLVAALWMLSALNTNAQEVNISFTPTQISGAKYSPNHIFAVWVKDANGNYVRTLMVYASVRKSYLYTWKSNSGGDVADAITGATVSTFKAYSITWDLKDYKNNTVADGSYKLCMEMTSAHSQGPYREIDFTVGGSNYTLSPADGQNFTTISLSYTGATTGSETTFLSKNYLTIYPNPSGGNLFADILLEQNSETIISIYSLENQLVLRKKFMLYEGPNHIDFSDEANTLPPGVYLFLVETNHYTLGNKFIIR